MRNVSRILLSVVVSFLAFTAARAENAIKVESTTAQPGDQNLVVRLLADNDDPILGFSVAGRYDEGLNFKGITVEGTVFGPAGLDADYVHEMHWGTMFGAALIIDLPQNGEPYEQKSLPAGTDQYILGVLFDVDSNLAGGTELSIDLRDDLRSTESPESPVVAPVFTVKGETVTPDLVDGVVTIVLPPTISAVEPDKGPVAGGTAVTVTGNDFTEDTLVTFGGVELENKQFVDADTITGTAPAHAAGAVDVTVTNSYGSDTLQNGFTYVAPPTISSVTPSSGPVGGGTTVTVTGTGFTEDTEVTFDGSALLSLEFVSDTTIRGTTPAHPAGAVDVTVSNPYGTDTLSSGFTYEEEVPPPPIVTSIEPGSGRGDVEVTIIGTNFTPETGVLFDGTPIPEVTVVSDTEIICRLPACTGSGVWIEIRVSTAGGTAVVEQGYFCEPEITFTRADANCDNALDIADAVSILAYLFSGGTAVCLDALDSNDSGAVDIADAIYILGYLFANGPEPPAPFPEPGTDPTPDEISCAAQCGG